LKHENIFGLSNSNFLFMSARRTKHSRSMTTSAVSQKHFLALPDAPLCDRIVVDVLPEKATNEAGEVEWRSVTRVTYFYKGVELTSDTNCKDRSRLFLETQMPIEGHIKRMIQHLNSDKCFQAGCSAGAVFEVPVTQAVTVRDARGESRMITGSLWYRRFCSEHVNRSMTTAVDVGFVYGAPTRIVPVKLETPSAPAAAPRISAANTSTDSNVVAGRTVKCLVAHSTHHSERQTALLHY
jgi:hypothetical protein